MKKTDVLDLDGKLKLIFPFFEGFEPHCLSLLEKWIVDNVKTRNHHLLTVDDRLQKIIFRTVSVLENFETSQYLNTLNLNISPEFTFWGIELNKDFYDSLILIKDNFTLNSKLIEWYPEIKKIQALVKEEKLEFSSFEFSERSSQKYVEFVLKNQYTGLSDSMDSINRSFEYFDLKGFSEEYKTLFLKTSIGSNDLVIAFLDSQLHKIGIRIFNPNRKLQLILLGLAKNYSDEKHAMIESILNVPKPIYLDFLMYEEGWKSEYTYKV